MEKDPVPIFIEPEKLKMDSANPRLAQYNLGSNATQEELIKQTWLRMACAELALSIALDRYWSHEPLFAIQDKDKDYIVIEGNRRLAAIKALLNTKLLESVAGSDFPSPTSTALASLKKIPVIVVNDRMDVWKYLGFKHVNGPAKWGSYAKAQYIATVHKHGIKLSDIAAQIGDTNRTVQRLYRAYMVIEQAEAEKLWLREYAYKSQLSFSHLMTGLDYDGIANFISVADKSDEEANPVPPEKLQNLKKLCEWLWGDNRFSTPPVIQSQNPDLRNLNQVLLSTAATEQLVRGQKLEFALEESKGDALLFAEALTDARLAVSRAQARVSEGFKGEQVLLDEARQVARMSVDLWETMQRKNQGPDDLKRRITE